MVQVQLREVEDADVEVFLAHQAEPEAVAMAAFPAREREAFEAHWARIRADDRLLQRTILADGEVAGYLGSWPGDDGQEVGYWVGQAFWGRGVATRALGLLLGQLTVRPLVAHVASHNTGSIRVLERCGFVRDPSQEAGPSDDGVQELAYVRRD